VFYILQTGRSKLFDIDGIVRSIEKINPKGIIYDLDNTLFWEIDYMKSYIQKISELVSIEKSPEISNQFYSGFMEEWESGRRRDLFQTLLDHFQIESLSPDNLIYEMETLKVPGGLRIRNWAKRALAEFKVPTAILTNGNPAVQRNKFSQLVPYSLVKGTELFCAKEYQPKPSPEGVKVILSAWALAPESVLFIGDSDLDEKCASSAGCKFINVSSSSLEL
jgi:phosphoglycolate phosphatase-like HAD superfamily hydrolase